MKDLDKHTNKKYRTRMEKLIGVEPRKIVDKTRPPHRSQRSRSSIPTAALILLWLLLYLYPAVGVRTASLCDVVFSGPYCHHNQSGLCGSPSCDHQLLHSKFTHNKDEGKDRCHIQRIKECGSITPSYIYSGEKPLAKLNLYHYSTWMKQLSIVNFTFPSPEWNSLRFQYKINNTNKEPFCLEFTLKGVMLPLVDTLMYDCTVYNVPGDSPRDAEVVLVNQRHEGNTFTFRIPSHLRIHPKKTRLKDWHVFFYLHQDYMGTSHLPVTVATVPLFHNLTYNVSMVKCSDDLTSSCLHYSPLHSKLVRSEDKDFTVKLPIWGNPGQYAVTVQIVSDFCGAKTGCYVSVSPTFEIKGSLVGVWMTGLMSFFLIALLTFLFLFSQRVKRNKKILRGLREVQPSVLLVYLADHQHYMEFINKFADFLKNICFIKPHLVDRDVGNQDPNSWTREHILSADKVLFIVPQTPFVESITPIRNQWIIALNYISGHNFTISNMSHKMAVVVLPSSGIVPSEIVHLYSFNLVDQISPLVNWLHGGTWLDEIFLWRPKLRWSSQEKSVYSWLALREVALKTTSETQANIPKGSIMYKDRMLKRTTKGEGMEDATPSKESSSDEDEEGDQAYDNLLDPNIPRFEALQMDEDSRVSISSLDSDDNDVRDVIFT